MEQIADDVFAITENLGSNNGMILTGEGIVLVDSPHKPTDAVRWRHEVESRGDVLYLVNTDHHIDHTMGNFFMPGRIIAYEGTRKTLLEGHPTVDFMRNLLTTLDPQGLPLMENYSYRIPGITFNDRMTLHLGGTTIELIHRRGHTVNGAMVYLPEQKILFSGDHVCEMGLPSFQESDVFAWRSTIEEILDMEIDTIVPGHGEVGNKEMARVFRDQIDELIGRVRAAMQSGVPKERIVEEIRFKDRIHASTDSYSGYPAGMMEEFQRKSMAVIYDQLAAKGGM